MTEVEPNTPEIPGFQPLHIRGPGRIGIWIEARQIRLDRRVLLKVLPASSRSQQDQFIEEIRAIVKLDGEGALRVIDEGAVGQARYVALDEGEGRPVGSISREEIDADQVARMLVQLHRQLHLQGWSIESVPLSSILKLPGGRFAVTELGPLIEQLEGLPCQIQAAKNLASIAERWKLSSRWQEPIRALRSGEGGFSRCLELLERSAPEPRKRWPLRVAALALVAGIAWAVNWGPPELPQPTPHKLSGSDSSAGVTDPSQGGRSDRRPSDGSAVVSDLVPDPQIYQQRTQAQAQQRWQRLDQLEDELRQWGDWNRSRDAILSSFKAGDYQKVRAQLDSLETPLQSDLVEERAALRLAYRWIETREIEQARVQAKQWIQRDHHLQAAEVIEKMAHTLGLERRFAGEVEQLQRKGGLYEELLSAVEVKMEECLVGLASDIEWSVEAPDKVGQFASLDRRWKQFQSSIESLRQDARAICESAGKRVGDEAQSRWCLVGSSPFAARVMSVSSQEVTLKRIGRRNPETHLWSSLSAQTWLQLIGESSADPPPLDRLERLEVVWSRENSILTLSRSSMGGELPAAADRLRRRQLTQWLEEGKRAQLQGEVEKLRQIALSIHSWSDAEQRIRHEDLLLDWWSALVDRDGPQALGLFAGASLSNWSQETRSIRIRWQRGAGGLAGWQPRPGSLISARGDLTRIQGRVTLESSVRFESAVEVTVIGLVTREDAPNLNVVLWDGSPDALIFGVGIRPPEVSSIRVGEDDVLLPAHAIVEEQLLAKGGGEFQMPTPLPRVEVGQLIRVEVREDDEGSHLELNGSPILSTDPRPGQRSGGIAIETYGVDVLVKELEVIGQISAEDWLRLLQEEARKRLREPQ